jgi:uncharacterized protein (DUF58 family)
LTPSELARKVRLLELRARKTVGHLTFGAYRSAFRGQGVEFQEIREYVPGDDTRSIDWNVTARLGRPFIKRFSEEREQTVIFVVDGSSSTFFGSGKTQKRDAIAEVFSTLAFVAANNNDEVGLIRFTGAVELYVPPAKGIPHMLRLIREMAAFESPGSGTDIGKALEFLMKIRHRRSFVFLLSDFLAHGFEGALRVCAKRHNLVAVSAFDPREEQLADCGLMEMEDPESGERWFLDTGDAEVRKAYRTMAEQRQARLRDLFQSAGIDHLRIEAGADFFPDLVRFLRNHARRN